MGRLFRACRSAKKTKSRVGYLPLCHGLGLPPGA